MALANFDGFQSLRDRYHSSAGKSESGQKLPNEACLAKALVKTPNSAMLPIADLGKNLELDMPMDVPIEKLKTVKPIAREELERAHTGSLLKRLEQLRSLQDSFEASDWLSEERDAVDAAGLIAFKNSNRWRAAFADLKALLSEREHLPRGSKEKRQQAAHQNQNR